MDLARLENFLQVASLGSLSRAADKMRIAQPALSRQMRQLEEEIGVQLFARHRRGMQLTEGGEELRRRLMAPLREIEQAFAEVRSLSGEAAGRIAFGMPSTVTSLLAGRFARRVAQDAPALHLRIVDGYSGHLVDWLQRGELDAAIIYGPASDFHMKLEELLIEPLMLVGAASSDLDPAVPAQMASLGERTLVLPSNPHGLRVVVEQAARRARTTVSVRHEADSFVVLKELVESGLGYTTLPLSAFEREASEGRLRYAPLTNPPVMRQLVLGMRAGGERSRAVQTACRLVKAEIRTLVEIGRWQAQLA